MRQPKPPKLDGRTNRLRAKAKAIEPTKLDETKPAIQGGSTKTKTGLTAKQQHFAELVAKGGTLRQSYEEAYGRGNCTDKSMRERACRLANEEKIQQYIGMYHEQHGKKQAKYSHDPESIRNLLLDYLIETVTKPTVKDADRNTAARLLGQVGQVALFDDKSKAKEPDESVKSAIDELKSRLNKMSKAQQPKPDLPVAIMSRSASNHEQADDLPDETPGPDDVKH